jgi:hypothetical protein
MFSMKALWRAVCDQAYTDERQFEYYPGWSVWIMLVATALAMLGLLAS